MSNKAKKILVFATNYNSQTGGAEVALREVMKRLDSFHFDVITSKIGTGEPQSQKSHNVTIYRVGGYLARSRFILPKLFLPAMIMIKGLRLLSKQGHYQAMLALQASQAAGGAWLIKLLKPTLPLIVNFQEGKNLRKQNILIRYFRKRILRKADIVTTISHYLRREAIGQGVNSARIVVVPNGVSFDKFDLQNLATSRREMRTKLGLENVVVIMTTGRLVDKNGVEEIVRAARILSDYRNMPQFKVVFVGTQGDRKPYLERLAAKLNVSDRIIFVDDVPYERMPQMLSAADVFVRPSRSEGFGNSILEAMAAGLPVVATGVGGMVDFLRDGMTGFICAPLDANDLANKIIFVLENKGKALEVSVNARAAIREKYDWSMIAEQYRNLLNKFLL